MFTIENSQADFGKFLAEVAKSLQVKINNDTLVLPESVGEGYFKYIPMVNGLQCMLTDFTLNEDLYMQCKAATKEFFLLRFEEVSISDTLMVKIDNDYTWEEKQNRASAFLTSSLFDFASQASKGTSIKSINVLITREWLEQYIDINSMDKVLKKYLQLKSFSYNFAPFDIEYRSLFSEVMEAGDEVMQRSIIENRVMMMVEKFLTHLYQKLNRLPEEELKIAPDEIKRLMEVESYLVKDFSTPPPPISYLSRVAAMSTTTLKNKFKKLYGNNLYEYFQKSRMHRAKVLLMSKKYSIKEIGNQLGYSNLSNFATAFKKEFKRLPSKLFMQNKNI